MGRLEVIVVAMVDAGFRSTPYRTLDEQRSLHARYSRKQVRAHDFRSAAGTVLMKVKVTRRFPMPVSVARKQPWAGYE